MFSAAYLSTPRLKDGLIFGFRRSLGSSLVQRRTDVGSFILGSAG